jgi:hypothetical protein
MKTHLPYRKYQLCILLFCFFGWVGEGLADADATPARYLFLDPAILERVEGAEIHVNPAERRETVILPDRPWEKHIISFFLTVRDEGGKLRMWYICRNDVVTRPDGGMADPTPDSQANVAYAESSDGIQWTKPSLGIYDYKGSKDNNLVGVHSLEGMVFQDKNAPASERYTYVSTGRPVGDRKGPVGIYRFHSPDGLRWERDAQPLIQAASDTQNVVWWDEHRKEYVVIVRGWENGLRKVSRLALPSLTVPATVKPGGTSRYFNNEIPTILACDEQDPPRTDVYNMSAQPYILDSHWYVAFPTFLRRWTATDDRRQPGMKRSVGPAEVQFAGSRDSLQWHRYDRTAYASPGIADPAKKNLIYMGTGMVLRGDEIWQYGTEFESAHGDIEARKRKTDGRIVRYVQRVDGFVSLDTHNSAGTARTVPVQITGTRLLVNLDTGALGELRVGLIGADGQPEPGFAIEDCEPIEYNGTGVTVTWKGGADLSARQGRKLALEFKSHRTKLYSFRFE